MCPTKFNGKITEKLRINTIHSLITAIHFLLLFIIGFVFNVTFNARYFIFLLFSFQMKKVLVIMMRVRCFYIHLYIIWPIGQNDLSRIPSFAWIVAFFELFAPKNSERFNDLNNK